MATNFGSLGTGELVFENLTIPLDPTGFFDHDWYTITAGRNGTLTATMSAIAFNGTGGLNERVFVLHSSGTLIEIGSATTPGAAEETVTVGVIAGQSYYVWVYGLNFSTGTYNLTLSIA